MQWGYSFIEPDLSRTLLPALGTACGIERYTVTTLERNRLMQHCSEAAL
jgi:hypothetical protein